MPAATLAATSQSNPFIRQLASSNRTTRDRALDSLRTFLHRPTPFSTLDLLKLWKGLHYCMFMSDKPRNQQRLARDLAELVDVLKTTTMKIQFIAAFWKTMSREWSGIDGLRMDKYLYLVRCYIGKGFEVCAKSKAWTKDGEEDPVWKEYVAALQEEGGPLSLEDAKNQVPVGLRLHVLDIWVDELEKVDVKGEVPVEKIMGPIQELADRTLTRSVRVRAKEALRDDRIRKRRGEVSEEEEEEEDDEEDAGEDDDFGGFDD
ncbi:unnamed protein product [Zymoseptoria tritici ST99CH_3D1]|uniref:Ribosomal RNA-processing protein 1 n=3 Tax=Zymoseptoria tritici TaxID=1047171 RepID=F9X0Q6_ZYMTI|nr:uncharacterized protein MYCGRDRAFT_67403 [Zymoseptoria tritici IPO323]EGP91720.1 hypothetical protein MYCGRDRAFT_67403 [Zymoseptoria tritici IPO323]SMQ46851.1 unnamed protein product [Zymoseptoria tritici ST99CH_3D7]SMR43215.1 unnamed protein product [Zymoseptoria tritici ST99CH_1E4]SMR45376.1 unnamed protein product [Zymoseptoria tritici ST99CH_3D1]